MYTTLFAVDNVMSQIRQGIVIPNVRLRDEDEEFFFSRTMLSLLGGIWKEN